MKTFNITVSICCLLAIAVSSCSLNTENEKNAPAYTALTSLEDLRATAANLYLQPWYEFHKRMYLIGDARANNLFQSTPDYGELNAQGTFNEAMSLQTVQRPWTSLYNVITQADYVVFDYAPYCVKNNICSEDDASVVVGEARLIRALAYYYLAIYWHNVPIVDNPTTMNQQARTNPFEDVLRYAIIDAEYAFDHLPTAPYAIGRVSQVTAATLLSRLYLTLGAYVEGEHCSEGWWAIDGTPVTANYLYTQADHYATEAIGLATSGGYGLMEDYEQIFRVQNNNCKEVLFALQFVAHNTTRGLANDLGASLCYSYCVDNNYGKAWTTYAGYDFLCVAALRGGMSRTRGNVFLPGTHYDYLYHELDSAAAAKRNDCRNHAMGETWTVDPSSTYVPIKKYVVGGPLATENVATNGNSGFCTPLLRLSEAYLNQTEARLLLNGGGVSSDNNVLDGINTIRRRAYKIEIEAGVYSGDYTTINLDTILQERRMEFFGEGLWWGDIVRRSFRSDEDLQQMLHYMNNRLISVSSDLTVGCHRQYKYKYVLPTDKTLQVGMPALATSGTLVYRASRECTQENLWAMMYPPSEVSLDPNLELEPVAYNFE